MRKILIVGITLLLGACASGARMNAMIAETTAENIISEENVLYQTIELTGVSGGKKTNPLWTSQIGDEEFQQALLNTLRAHALISIDDAKFQLSAKLEKINQPLFGFDLSVTSIIRYELKEVSTQKIVYDETITVEYTADFSDAMLGSKRLQLANEGAIRENISKFLTSLIAKSKSKQLVSNTE